MGCDAASYLVKSDILKNNSNLKKYTFTQWDKYMEKLPEVGGRPADNFGAYIDKPQDLWFLWDFCKLDKLAIDIDETWTVLEMTQSNVYTLIDFCKQIITTLLDVESQKDLEKTELKDLYYTDSKLSQFCKLLKILQINKKCLIQYPNHSILMLIYW